MRVYPSAVNPVFLYVVIAILILAVALLSTAVALHWGDKACPAPLDWSKIQLRGKVAGVMRETAWLDKSAFTADQRLIFFNLLRNVVTCSENEYVLSVNFTFDGGSNQSFCVAFPSGGDQQFIQSLLIPKK